LQRGCRRTSIPFHQGREKSIGYASVVLTALVGELPQPAQFKTRGTEERKGNRESPQGGRGEKKKQDALVSTNLSTKYQ